MSGSVVMKTPRLFSPAVAKTLLPESLGADFQRVMAPVAKEARHRCELTGFPYPQTQDKENHSWLMLEPREEMTVARAGNAKPLIKTPEQLAQDIKNQGINSKTVRAVCPLYFWARHTDLALSFRRGSLVFAPWISQTELLQFFRALMVASIQKGVPAATDARQTLYKFGALFGNGSTLCEVTGFPEDTEWTATGWLKSVRRLPARERRTYLQRFGVNLRFWPDPDAFKPLAPYWAKVIKTKIGKAEQVAGTPWMNHYQSYLRELQNKNLAPVNKA